MPQNADWEVENKLTVNFIVSGPDVGQHVDAAIANRNEAEAFRDETSVLAANAATSESNAATSESNASTSEANAATSETNASNSEIAAADSEAKALISETNSANSETAAAGYASTAQAAQAATELLFDNFDDKFLGTKSSDPTVDNDGNTLVEGAMYYNSDDNAIKFYDGNSWQAPSVTATNAANSATTSANNAATSESNAADSANTAVTAKNDAETARDAAQLSEANAANSEINSANSATEANDYKNLAMKWATEDEDVEVEPGLYSAMHWAFKSAALSGDANTLDGQDSAYYRNADNINAGTLSSDRLPSSINSDTSGNAATADSWSTARTITLDGDATGSVSLDGSSDVTMTVTIDGITHNHDSQYLGINAKAADSELLDGLDSTHFKNASNLDSGIIPDERLPSNISSDITGNAATADSWSTARTLTLQGSATGSATIDGSGDVNLITDVSLDNLSGKESGTGDYATTGALVAGKGSGGVALTTNDGFGNANVTFNHKTGLPEQDGNAARISVNTDSSNNAEMDFQVKSGLLNSNGSQAITSVFTLDETNTTVKNNLVETSDERIKENIKPLDSRSLENLKPVVYNKIGSEVKEIGFIAQDVEIDFPELVTEDQNGIKAVSYSRMTAVLLQKIQELEDKINKLENTSK